jgi:hypothetical protein
MSCKNIVPKIIFQYACMHQNGSAESDFHPPSTLKGSVYFILYITEFLII